MPALYRELLGHPQQDHQDAVILEAEVVDALESVHHVRKCHGLSTGTLSGIDYLFSSQALLASPLNISYELILSRVRDQDIAQFMVDLKRSPPRNIHTLCIDSHFLYAVEICKLLPDVQVLEFDHLNLNVMAVLDCLKAYPSLKGIRLTECFRSGNDISPIFNYILYNNKELVEFGFNNEICDDLTLKALTQFIARCNTLERIKLGDTVINKSSLAADLFDALKSKPNLKYFEAERLYYIEPNVIHDLAEILKNTTIEHLDFGFYFLSKEHYKSLQHLLQNCPHLKSLHLRLAAPPQKKILAKTLRMVQKVPTVELTYGHQETHTQVYKMMENAEILNLKLVINSDDEHATFQQLTKSISKIISLRSLHVRFPRGFISDSSNMELINALGITRTLKYFDFADMRTVLEQSRAVRKGISHARYGG